MVQIRGGDDPWNVQGGNQSIPLSPPDDIRGCVPPFGEHERQIAVGSHEEIELPANAH